MVCPTEKLIGYVNRVIFAASTVRQFKLHFKIWIEYGNLCIWHRKTTFSIILAVFTVVLI